MNDNTSITLVNETQLKNLISNDPTIQLVDVRTALEYNRGNIKPAVNIDYMSSGFLEKFNTYKKDEPLYIYCRSGARSGKAAFKLAKAGFTKIYDLEGGISQWN